MAMGCSVPRYNPSRAVQNHAFHNANKRTAFLSLLQFLSYNGYVFVIDQKQAEDFVVDVVNRNYTFEQMAAIIELHSRKR